MIEHFSRNTKGHDYIVGDIHGCFSALQSALDFIGFDPERDRLFSVGDLVDRGPESDSALEWLARPWFHAVRGNHEDMAIRWAKPDSQMDASVYVRNGGAWNVGNPPEARQQFADAFSAMPMAIELETADGLVGIVHADCPFDRWSDLHVCWSNPEVPKKIRKQVRAHMMWSRDRIEEGRRELVEGVRAVVVGHTIVSRPGWLANTFYIDTGAVRTGIFTILDAATLTPVDLPAKPLEWTS